MITVRELRDALYKYDDDAVVMIPLDTEEGSFASLVSIKYVRHYEKNTDEFEPVKGEVLLLP